jgi:putative hydrolase of the HAD superfamily
MIKSVVFDLDDTLFSEYQFVLSGFRAVSTWLTINCAVRGFFPVAELLFRDGKRGNIFNLALDQLDVGYDDEYIRKLIQVYREHQPELSLYDDAKWAIDHFRQNKRLGIITDGNLITQRNKISALNIDEYFDIIIYSDEFGRESWKPSEVPYRKIMDAFEYSGDEFVYIADNPAKDFITAKKLNWQTIQICREAGEYTHLLLDNAHEADIKIDSLHELKKLIS